MWQRFILCQESGFGLTNPVENNIYYILAK